MYSAPAGMLQNYCKLSKDFYWMLIVLCHESQHHVTVCHTSVCQCESSVIDVTNASLPGSCQQRIAYGEQMGCLQFTAQKRFTKPVGL